MKNIVSRSSIILIMLMLFNNCTNNRYSKDNHVVTFEIEDGIYKERFEIPSGGGCLDIMTADYHSEYITDSVNFRKFLGICADHYWFVCKMNGRYIDVYQTVGRFEALPNGGARTVEDTIYNITYNIDKLKREGKFE